MKPSQLFFFFLLATTAFSATAQKLPNIQTASLRAPANVKIDGKGNEWKDQFQAYNKATDVYYTVANDDKKLYLTIQSADEYVIKKMLWGRTILTISQTNKKTDTSKVTISYPIISRNERPSINFKDKPEVITGNTRSISVVDSFMKVNNQRLAEKSKLIKVTGIKGLDSLISVYNADGILAASGFNDKMVYTYELAIDLKLLRSYVNSAGKFYYNLMLTELPMDDYPGINIERAPNGEIKSVTINKSQANSRAEVFRYTTDFWGEYTLAK